MSREEFNTKAAVLYSIAIARSHQNHGDMASSASLCADDALSCFESGNIGAAYRHAVKSLEYSVGRYHRDYARVAAMERA